MPVGFVTRSKRLAQNLRLQVETEKGNHFGDVPAVRNESIQILGSHGRYIEQACIVAEFAREPGFPNRLLGRSDDPGDQHRYFSPAVEPLPRSGFFGRQSPHRLKQPGLGIVNAELGRVNAHGKSCHAGIEVIPCEGFLAAFIELSGGIEGEGMSGDDTARKEPLAQVRFFHGCPLDRRA